MKTIPKILIVDDRQENIIALEEVLIDVFDVEIINAISGNDAIKQALVNNLDLILMDVQMPGMDGFETVELIKKEKRNQNIPIIFLSAIYSDDRYKIKGLKSGGVDFISKPFNEDYLIGKIKVFLEIQALRKELTRNNEDLRETNKEISSDAQKTLEINARILKSEEQLKKLNEAKDKFFTIMAHDIKSPLSAFKSMTALMQADFDNFSRDDIQEILTAMSDSAKQLYSLLENILTWSRMQTNRIEFNPENSPLDFLINTNCSLLKMSAEKKKINLTSEFSGNINVFIDSNMITTVLRNLISNAIKFTCEGGKIKILATEDFRFVTVSISDNGIGIEPDDIGKLFRIDVHHSTTGTLDEAGTGLGLILCKEFVEKHGCKIWVESEIGKGSSFIFTLPKEK